MKNMVDIITKIIGKQKVATLSPADLGILMGGGLFGYFADSIARGAPQIPPGWFDVIALILSGAGAFYLKQPWNTLSAGAATGITIGALRSPIVFEANKVVAKANGVNNVKGSNTYHMGMTTPSYTPNTPYVGMIHPNIVYTSGGVGYTQDMMGAGLSNSYSVKAPIANGPRYTV